MRRSFSTLLAHLAWLVCFGSFATACGQASSGTGNTNWKIECSSSSECPGTLTCACGHCGTSCDGTLVCRASDSEPMCSKDAPVTSPGPSCPTFPSLVSAPTALETTSKVLAPAEVALAVADDSGLYWLDRQAGVFGLPRGETSPKKLNADATNPAMPGENKALLGLISDDDKVYWAEAAPLTPPAEPGPPSPPGRLHAVAKAGGPDLVLVELPNDVLYPLAIDGGRVIAWLAGEQSGLVAVSTLDGEIQRLAAQVPSGPPRLFDGAAYWLESETSTVFRVSLEGGKPQPIVTLKTDDYASGFFRPGPGFVLWQRQKVVLEPLTMVQNFMMFDEATGCVKTLPGLGQTISSEVPVSPPYVYWKTFNGLDSFSPEDPPTVTPLVRIDLQTGDIERVVTPGFELTLVDDFVAQDESNLYVHTNSGNLVSIEKPR
jgi:hypothetical protein